MMFTRRYDPLEIAFTALLGLNLLSAGCGDGGSVPSSHTAGPETATSAGTTQGTMTTAETASIVTTAETASTGEGEGTTSSTSDPTTMGGSAAEGSGTEDDSTGQGTTTTSEGDVVVGLIAESLCEINSNAWCAIRPDGGMRCWGDVEHDWLVLPLLGVKSAPGLCHLVVLEDGSLHRVVRHVGQEVELPQGPFELAGGTWPYGCGFTTEGSMSCWVAPGYEPIVEPPSGPFDAILAPSNASCMICGVRGTGELLCWPIPSEWPEWCEPMWAWVAEAKGDYIPGFGLMDPTSVLAINHEGQLFSWTPAVDALVLNPHFVGGGFVEARPWGLGICGLTEEGEIRCLAKGEWAQSPLVAGVYTTFLGGPYGGCAIRADDSRVVCWGDNDYGLTDPPQD